MLLQSIYVIESVHTTVSLLNAHSKIDCSVYTEGAGIIVST